MKLVHRTALDAAPEDVFALVSDAQRIAALLPGAVLEGEVVRGHVDVDGRETYAGRLRLTEVAPAERRVRVSARGAHDRGTVAADVALAVEPSPSGAVLEVHTDLVLTGPLARFGTDAARTLATRLLDRVAHHLTTHASDASSLTVNVSNAPSSAPAPPESADPVTDPVTAAEHPRGRAPVELVYALTAAGALAAGGYLLIKELRRVRR